MVGVVLVPDRNRPELESRVARELSNGNIIDSLKKLDYNPWDSGEIPRVMLVVPPYTRLKRPLDIVLDNLERDEKNAENLRSYRGIVSVLMDEGITHLEEMKRAGVPMGLLRVGTAAKKAGYEVKILDAVYEGWNDDRHYFTTLEGSEMRTYGLTKEDTARRIQSFNPHVVGITIDYTHQWGNAREIADLVKKLNEKTIVVIGGTHASGLISDVLLDSPTDYVVFKQSDITFPELLDNVTGKSPIGLENILGIAYRKNGKVIQNEEMPNVPPSRASIIIPDYTLVNLDIYSGPYHSAGRRVRDYGRIAYFFTSIGCNVRCKFCAIPNVQGGWVPIGEQNLPVLFNQLRDMDITEGLLEDDMLLQDPKWALKVFKAIKPYDIKWVEEGGLSLFTLAALLPQVGIEEIKASVNNKIELSKKYSHTLKAKEEGITTHQLIDEMANSGCYSVYLAVESANPKSLSTSNKPTINSNPEYTNEIVKYLASRGIRTTCGLMLGFVNPNGELYSESREDIMRTIRYGQDLIESGAVFANPFIFTPLPAAPDFHDLEKRLGSFLKRNTDEGFSHEFATIDAPNRAWTRDALNLLRVYSMLQTIGVEGYKYTLRTGTWPVRR